MIVTSEGMAEAELFRDIGDDEAAKKSTSRCLAAMTVSRGIAYSLITDAKKHTV